MHTQEKPTSSYANHSNEAPRSYEEEAAQIPSDVLRRSLLTAPESRGNQVPIPAHTVAVRMNISAYNPNVAAGMSNLVDTIQEHNVHGKGWGELGETEALSSLDKSATHDRENGETFANVTFLYDSQPPLEGETRIPSAVIAHEDLSELRIRELREKLPDGVPILDGKTNDLLDDVGKDEREKERKRDHVKRDIGFEAFFMSGGRQNYKNRLFEDSPNGRHSRFAGFEGINMEDLLDIEENAQRYEQYSQSYTYSNTQEKSNDSWSQKSGWEGYYDNTPVPESEEVRTHRERVEKAEGMLNEAAAKYGSNSWRDLDVKDQERVKRQVMRSVHPDASTGDEALFKEVEILTKDIQKAKQKAEPRSDAKETPEQKEPAEPAESEPSAPVQPEDKQPLELEAAEADVQESVAESTQTP